jgi:predicted CXXCH cytochrome family protein
MWDRKIYKWIFIYTLICVISFGLSFKAIEAKITGPCANCHTMHNSQDGNPVAAGGPYAVLLVNNCIGCHSATNPATGIDATTGAPIVYNIGGPPTYGVATQGLAGGNFYWVAQGDDTKGHNVFPANQDDNLSIAPGRWTGCAGGGDVNSCHKNLSTSTNPNQFGFTYPRQGCTKCHMVANSEAPKGFHHRATADAVIDSYGEGWYRFLTGHNPEEGVTGIEDNDWQFTFGANNHNEYLGFSGNKSASAGFSALGNTMTAYCCGCHGDFHKEDTTVVGTSPWIRHPSDALIPNSGEYASAFGASGGTGTYDPQVPVARPNLAGWTGPSPTVTIGTDMVMCLSCHKPHGSPYSDMLRWDYSTMIAAGGGSGGCFACHTTKDNTP